MSATDDPAAEHTADPHPTPEDAVTVVDLSFGPLYASALRTAAVHRIADHLTRGPLAVDELARRAGVRADPLRRVLRLLASRGVFREAEPGVYTLTATAALLQDAPGSLRDMVLFGTSDLMVRTCARLDEAVRTGRPAFDEVHGAPFFDYLAAHPDTQTLFDNGMASLSGPLDDVIAATYPFPDSGTVVDVGGGQGGLLAAVLRRHPGLTGVLFDQERTVAGHRLDGADLAGRWRVESGDFFTAVPAGGDRYFLKHILHDWDDEECLRILRAVRAVVPPRGRLVVVDTVMPEGDAPDLSKTLDVAMMAVLKGRERTRDEFASLFARGGFRLTRVLDTPGFPALVEAEPG
ncbi:methyltransferase [Streptomyces longispororuber]|uniref:Methyltransferase n=1 Tax=Streptomyces longispororuber TaxID=68230 RepID=A0A919A3U4_9ACTN|nr:methyltransferase [Streptomyces longispororuber]GHE84201.1 methyltransferase [Streptomyces longispororuber]